MDVTISVVIGADRRLVVDLPPTTPLGPAELVVRTHGETETPVQQLTRDAAHAKLRDAGLLAMPLPPPEGATLLTDAEVARTGSLPPSARPSEELVAEDRGAW